MVSPDDFDKLWFAAGEERSRNTALETYGNYNNFHKVEEHQGHDNT